MFCWLCVSVIAIFKSLNFAKVEMDNSNGNIGDAIDADIGDMTYKYFSFRCAGGWIAAFLVFQNPVLRVGLCFKIC